MRTAIMPFLLLAAAFSSASEAQTQMGGHWQYLKNDGGAVIGWKGGAASEEFAGPVLSCNPKQKTLEIGIDFPDEVKAGTAATATLTRGESSELTIKGTIEDGISGPLISQNIPYASAKTLLTTNGDLKVMHNGKDGSTYSDSQAPLQFRRFVKSCGKL